MNMASPASVVSAVTMSPPPTGSEAPGCDPQLAALTAERKRKRKESNRLSAQRSRARKQRQLDELTDHVAALRARNGAMAAAVYDIERRCAAAQAENTLLQSMNLELGERLQSLTELIQWMEGAMYHQPQPQLLDANMLYNNY